MITFILQYNQIEIFLYKLETNTIHDPSHQSISSATSMVTRQTNHYKYSLCKPTNIKKVYYYRRSIVAFKHFMDAISDTQFVVKFTTLCTRIEYTFKCFVGKYL